MHRNIKALLCALSLAYVPARATVVGPTVLSTTVSASANSGKGTLTITGQNFSSGAVVTLNNLSFPVVSASATQIVANFPNSAPISSFAPGTYALSLGNTNPLLSIFLVGFTAEIGGVGPQGPTGAPGPAGPAGQNGAAGAIGPQGPPGPTGPMGVMGLIGATGPAGPIGPTGKTGPSGPAGSQGTAGATGPAGATGASGPTGPSGANFAVSPQQIATLKWYGFASTPGPNATTINMPTNMAFDGQYMWVLSAAGPVVKFDTLGEQLGSYGVCIHPGAIAYDGAFRMYVSCPQQGTVTQVLPDGTLAGTYALGGSPQGIACDGLNMWVANFSNNTVVKLDARLVPSNAPVTIPVGRGPSGVAVEGTHVWVTNATDNTVTEIDAASGSVLGTFAAGGSPAAIAFDGAHMWVANEFSPGSVTEIDVSNGKTLGTFPVAAPPVAIAFDGRHMWVSSAGNVIEFDAANGQVLGSFPIGTSSIFSNTISTATATGLAFDGRFMWVGDLGNNLVVRF